MNIIFKQFGGVRSSLTIWVIMPVLALSVVGCSRSFPDVPTLTTQRSNMTLTPTGTPTIALTKTHSPTSSPAPTMTPIPDPSLFSSPTATDSEVRIVQWAEWILSESYYAAWLPDSQSIVFAGIEPQGLGASTYLYDVNTHQLIWQIDNASTLITINPDGDSIVGGGGALLFWDAKTGQEIAPPYGGNATLFPAFLPDGSVLIIGATWAQGNVGEDSLTNIGIWKPEEQRWDTIIEHEGLLTTFVVSPDGTLLATVLGALFDSEGRKHHEVFTWDLAARSVRCDFLGDDVAFSPVGSILAIVDNSIAEKGKVLIYDTNTCQHLKTLYQAEYIFGFAYSPDGQMLALVSEPEDTIRLLDFGTGQLLYEQSGQWDTVWQLTFSPDGQFLMSRESYGTEHKIHIWKVITKMNH